MHAYIIIMATADEIIKLRRDWDEGCYTDDEVQRWVPAPTIDDVHGINDDDKFMKRTFKHLMEQYPSDVQWPVELHRAFVTSEPTDLATRWMLAEFTYMLGVHRHWMAAWLVLRNRFASMLDARAFYEIFDMLDKCLKAESATLKRAARKKISKMTYNDLKKKRFNPYATVKDDEKVERFHYDHLSAEWYQEYDADIVWKSHGLSFKPFPITADEADHPMQALVLAMGR
jgi:hypothetical protein